MNQGCQSWDFIPRSWEFSKLIGLSWDSIFPKTFGINLGNFREFPLTVY